VNSAVDVFSETSAHTDDGGRELSFLVNVAAGEVGAAEIAWLRKSFTAFLNHGGELQLERCLHLPTTPKKLADELRNCWLRRAWELTTPVEPYKKAAALQAEIRTFESRVWPHWCKNDAPPEHADDLRQALFYAMKANEKNDKDLPGSKRRIKDICA
jgi:hypothetical protein